jgi:hypothetical protein
VRHVVRVQLDCDLDIVLFVVLLDVLERYVHVVKPVQVGSDKRDPIEPPVDVLLVDGFIELLGDFLDALQEVFHEDALVLVFNLALQVDVN